MRRVLAVIGLTVAFALGTWVAWWMVPLVAFLWAILPPPRPAVLPAALAAASAWALWLGFDAAAGGGGLGRLAARLSGVMHLPSPVLILLTLLFPALLAASAAAIGGGFAAALATRRGGHPR
jgi:hypothetical protein